jgi:putative Mg2+ transporter-C (MgtC) family protein
MLTVQFTVGAVLALIFGYVIGWDREKREKPAGITTHSFVILGSMIFTMLSTLDTSGHMRIAAAVVQGIGFLGAGMIIKSDDGVENLTTAAGVWVSAAVGMALGYQMYLIAFMTVIMMFCARFLPHPKRKE